MGKTIRHTLISVQDLVVGWLPWEQERLLLTVGKSDGFSEMKSKLKAAASGEKNDLGHAKLNRVTPGRAKQNDVLVYLW